MELGYLCTSLLLVCLCFSANHKWALGQLLRSFVKASLYLVIRDISSAMRVSRVVGLPKNNWPC